MKRNIKHSTLLLMTWAMMGLTTSCDSYLDVLPSTEKEKTEMLSTADGYRAVLTGAYIRMKQTSLYGQEMVCGTVENLAQHWSYTTGSIGAYLQNYDYTASVVETATENMYNNLYKVVADVNGILMNIDNNNGVLTATDYSLIKGEALGLRAFCHFDVLRLFGPMPTSLPTGRVLPYVTTVSNKPNTFLTYADYTTQLLADLQEAETLLAKVDPIRQYSIASLNSGDNGIDDFMQARQIRMNYYAVCALEARVYLWLGNKAKALEYAKRVIDAKTPTGASEFTLGTRDDCARGDKTLSPEHIFNLKVSNIASTIGSGRSYYNAKATITARLWDAGTSDIRFVNMWEEVRESYYSRPFYFLKYTQNEKMPTLAKNVIPLLRLAEMYLIAIECSPLPEASEYYKTLCAARDITPVTFDDEAQRTQVLIQEYNKEFFGEGQAFYAYKRLAAKDIYWAGTEGSVETYVVPLPLKEQVYAND